MSCFLDANATPDTDLQSFDVRQRQMQLVGSWSAEKDSKGLTFQVSKTSGGTVTVVFTGTSIYISGRVNSKVGMEALFGVDEAGKEGEYQNCGGWSDGFRWIPPDDGG